MIGRNQRIIPPKAAEPHRDYFRGYQHPSLPNERAGVGGAYVQEWRLWRGQRAEEAMHILRQRARAHKQFTEEMLEEVRRSTRLTAADYATTMNAT